MMAKAKDVRGLRSISQARDRLCCSRWQIHKLIKTGELELVKFGRRSLITERSLRRFEDALMTKATNG